MILLNSMFKCSSECIVVIFLFQLCLCYVLKSERVIVVDLHKVRMIMPTLFKRGFQTNECLQAMECFTETERIAEDISDSLLFWKTCKRFGAK